MRIQIRVAEYKEYFLDIEPGDVIDDDLNYTIKDGLKDVNLNASSGNIILDTTILPMNQEDYDYLENKDIYIEQVYKEYELERELQTDYEKSLGLEGEVEF